MIPQPPSHPDNQRSKLWEGRFSEKTEKIVETFTSSIHFDKRLYLYDIEGSIAHCRMLAKTEILSQNEADQLVQGLSQVKTEIESGNFHFDDALEDIHTHVEHRLAEIIGSTARKLHTARSRNDQIALDVRMYLRLETRRVIDILIQFRQVLIELAESHIDVIMPGYTHLQRAQPILLSHHLMAYYEMLSRDTERFRDCLKRIDVMPLGSAALAGTTYPIDRKFTAELLGFPEISKNSLDAVSDRDFIIEFMSCASICMVHLSRLSEEMVLWSSSEFGFIELPDAFATGSSIMPQKKNPDVPELVRGKTGRVFGDLMFLLTLMKGLPLAYNRDMQEDKPALFNSVDTLKSCLEVYICMLPNIRIRKNVMEQAAQKGYLNATDLADYLVTKGLTFREAHGCAGKAVSDAISRGIELHEMNLDDMKSISPLISEEIYDILTPDSMIRRRTSFGGTAQTNVKGAIEKAKIAIKNETAS